MEIGRLVTSAGWQHRKHLQSDQRLSYVSVPPLSGPPSYPFLSIASTQQRIPHFCAEIIYFQHSEGGLFQAKRKEKVLVRRRVRARISYAPRPEMTQTGLVEFYYQELPLNSSSLLCDATLRRYQYRDSHELDIARIIMEHIDANHASISHEVNIEIGASYTVDPLPATGDDRCRCPLQRLDMSNIPRNCLNAESLGAHVIV